MATKMCDAEQTLRIWLFPHDDNCKPIVDITELEILISEYMGFLTPLIQDYIWNCDSFSLNAKISSTLDESSCSVGPHIYGKMSVGDNIEDEWFVVFLMMELSKKYKNHICRITDTDGEFLLIEAAQHLPKWVNPDTAEQRVYIKNGQIHLIPHRKPITPNIEIISMMEAVNEVNLSPSKTVANDDIQNDINRKIGGYPVKIRQDQHVAHAYVPVGVAALLNEYPTLISPCVSAFCKRDNLDNKSLRVMKHFPPEQRVKTAIRLPKVLYAQLCAQNYLPDPRTGWNLPLPTDPKHSQHLLGIKLACGFEILVCNAGGVIPPTPTDDVTGQESTFDLNNPKWLRYKTSLENKGYFRGELEGSKLYKELEKNARHFFMANVLTSNCEENDELSMGVAVIKLLSKVNADFNLYKNLENNLVPADDEKWLEITHDSLDTFLESQYGTGVYNAPKSSTDKEIMSSLTTFFNTSSNVDGVDIPKDLRAPTKPIRKKSNRKVSDAMRKVSSVSNASQTSNSSQMSSFSNKINFNVEAFTDAVNNILELNLPEDQYFGNSDEESSGMSSYEDDDNDISLSRKSSDSQKSKASSGIDADIVDYMRQMETELQHTTIADNLSKKKVPLATFDEDDLEVDTEIFNELMKTFDEQQGTPGPVSTLLGSLGMKPSK